MTKSQKQFIFEKRYTAVHSEDGKKWTEEKISFFDIVHICDYSYKDFLRGDKKWVAFHHNDFWKIRGQDLISVINWFIFFYKKDWCEFINGKWRLSLSKLKEEKFVNDCNNKTNKGEV